MDVECSVYRKKYNYNSNQSASYLIRDYGPLIHDYTCDDTVPIVLAIGMGIKCILITIHLTIEEDALIS